MIELSLAKFSADRIGKFDFALENSGGSVILDKCSNTYAPSIASVSLFGYQVWPVTSTPKVIIQVKYLKFCTKQCTNRQFTLGYL